MTDSTGTTEPQYRKRSRGVKPLIFIIAALAAIAIAAVALIFANQGGNGEAGGNGNGSGGETGGETPAEQREITIGLNLAPGNFDIRNTGGVALDQILIDNVYQGLVGLRSGTLDEFVPVLAEELPEVSADGLTYTFALREGVRFHSGNELTTTDVIHSLGHSENLFDLGRAAGTTVTVTAPDDRTVVLTLDAPNSQLLWLLANRQGLITEAAYTGDLASTANGTGPYLLDDWRQGDSITFVANPDYWGDAPTLDRVVWAYFDNINAAMNAALSGDVDVLAPVASSLVSQLSGSSDFALERAASTDVFTLVYNSAKAPLDDVRVRTALSKAIDTEAIIAAFYGDGKPLGGPITDIEPAFEDLTSINSYDPEGARQLLAEAGVTDLSLTVTIPNFYPTDAINLVVTQFADIGVTLRVDPVEFGTWLSTVYAAPEDGSPRQFDLSYVNHAEPNDFVNYVNPDYYFGSVNPEALSLYNQAIAETDAARANELIAQAARVVANDAPAKWLINYTPTNAIGTNVSGFPQMNTNSRINLDGVSID